MVNKEHSKCKRGFITVATGNEKYYKVAANLLKSYRYFAENPLPFAILADEENEYTALFDDVIILKNPSHSYLDKIYLLDNIPYDETLFVESDCLAYGDLNVYFDAFENADDFSILGTNYPLDHQFTSGWGWFEPSKMGKYEDKIHFIPRFGSTFMYMRRGEICRQVYEICIDVWKDSDLYGFLPLDDQLLAVGCAVMNCRCSESGPKYDCCVYPFYKEKNWKPNPQMHKKKLRYARPDYGNSTNALLCHWGNYLTEKALYKREVFSLNMLIKNNVLLMNIGVFVYNLIMPFSDMSIVMERNFKKVLGIVLENKTLRKMLYPIEALIKKFRK